MTKIAVTLISIFSMLDASVEIYKDRTKLSVLPIKQFVGFNSNIKATDSAGDIKIVKGQCAGSRLTGCQPINKIARLKSENASLNKQKTILGQTLDELCFDSKDATKTILYVKSLSDKLSQIDEEIIKNNYLLSRERNKITSPALSPYFTDKKFSTPIELEFTGISFNSQYVLNIDEKKMGHIIEMRNRSGVDIEKTDAQIFDRRLSGIASNEKFRPLLIRTAHPAYKRKASAARMMKEEQAVMSMSFGADSVAETADETIAVKESTRRYTINNFSLKADGIRKEFEVDSKNVSIKKSLVWKAWQYKVYESAEVELDEVFESSKLDLIYNKEMIKKAYVRREGSKLLLNIAEEYEVEVSREEIPNFSQDKGLFGSDNLVEKGFRLAITNQSDNNKALTIVEKLPVSTNENVEVVLKGFWKIEGKERTKVELKHDAKIGRMEISIDLSPGESRVYEYNFSIRHPKESPIVY